MIKIIWPGIKESMDFAQNYPITAQVILRFIMVMLTCKLKEFANYNKDKKISISIIRHYPRFIKINFKFFKSLKNFTRAN